MYRVEEKAGGFQTFHRIAEINDFVNKIGSDGGKMVWFTDAKTCGVINYYNSIYAYVIYEEEPEEKKEPSSAEVVLRTALQQYDKDDLVCLLEKYSYYVASVSSEVPDLLKYLMSRQ